MKKIGVIGCGFMGWGIVEVVVCVGYSMVVCEVVQEFFDVGFELLWGLFECQFYKECILQVDFDDILVCIEGMVLFDLLVDCDFVIEVIVENCDVKVQFFDELYVVVQELVFFVFNIFLLMLIQFVVGFGCFDCFVGIYFFNLVLVMKLIEVICMLVMLDDVFDCVWLFVELLGKMLIVCKDNLGFIVNCFFVLYLFDVICVYENGIGMLEDIDIGMKFGCGYLMGLFMFFDFIGFDMIYFIVDIMFDEYCEVCFVLLLLLKQMVQVGCLGRKSG